MLLQSSNLQTTYNWHKPQGSTSLKQENWSLSLFTYTYALLFKARGCIHLNNVGFSQLFYKQEKKNQISKWKTGQAGRSKHCYSLDLRCR